MIPVDVTPDVPLRIERVAKTFTLHLQDGATIPVFAGVDLAVPAGDCVALTGSSGSGKSTLMRMIYGNYRAPSGRIWIWHDDEAIDLAAALPHVVLDVRRRTMGYVSQFLRVVPRVPAIEIVAEPARRLGASAVEARERAASLLDRLAIPQALWDLPPATFSGGEQQRVNLARGFMVDYPIMLLDEPTASLDAANRATVVRLIQEARDRGAAIVGIFHDRDVREAVMSHAIDMTKYKAAA